MSQYNTITHQSIKELMDIFYAKVRNDENLGPIFKAQIGDEDSRWETHKEHIGKFWKQMLLGEMGFEGQPMKKHLELPPFPRERFNDWLTLFEDSLNKVHTKEVAQEILLKAKAIAQRFQQMLYEVPHH